jgi:hypothetical protein
LYDQSVKTTHRGIRGYDSGKQVTGRTCNLLVDAEGLVVRVAACQTGSDTPFSARHVILGYTRVTQWA